MTHNIQVHVPAPAPEPRRRPLRLKPVGWLALIVVVLFVVSGGILAVQSIVRRTQTLAVLPPMSEYTPPPRTPTITPRPTRTLTPGPTATPEGWTLVHDPVTGEEYLLPPPADEAAIREAFEAVLRCDMIEDVPDEVALQYDRETALQKAAQFSTHQIVDYYRQQDLPAVLLVTMGPENPVRCQDYSTCMIGQAKLGSNGAVFYSDSACSPISGENVCVVRPPIFEDGSPYALFIATVELQGYGEWIITDLHVEKLPEPPQPSQS